MTDFSLSSTFTPSGDQPGAIKSLSDGIISPRTYKRRLRGIKFFYLQGKNFVKGGE